MLKPPMTEMKFHENLDRELPYHGPSDKVFGLTFFALFAIVALLPLIRHKPPRVLALVVGGVFLLLAIALPNVLTPLNFIWTRIGLHMGRVSNLILTSIMFYLLFAPASLILRYLGKDPLRLKFDREATSYWIPRVPTGPDPESVRHQF